jgi:hypothetical protein
METYTTEKAYPQYKFTSAPDFPLHFHLSDSVYEAERFIEIETPEPFVFSGIKFQECEGHWHKSRKNISVTQWCTIGATWQIILTISDRPTIVSAHYSAK